MQFHFCVCVHVGYYINTLVSTGGPLTGRVLLFVDRYVRDDEVDGGVFQPLYKVTSNQSVFFVNEEDCMFLVCRTVSVERGGVEYVCCLYC